MNSIALTGKEKQYYLKKHFVKTRHKKSPASQRGFTE
jgi:hypothetical protein